MVKKTVRTRLISLLIIIVFFCQMTAPAFASETFSDMVSEDSWSHDALMTAIETGLLRGDNGEIRPHNDLTRAEMITIVLRVLGLDDSQARDLAPFKADISAFVDVPAHAWYHDEIAMANKLQLLNGTSENEMSPDGIVSREQAIVVLCRALGLDALAEDESALNRFRDAGDLSSWARHSAAVMADRGYMNGSDGALYPLRALTRQEFAQMLHNIFESNYVTSQVGADALSGKKVVGSIAVSAEGITLSDLVVDSDVVIGDGVGDGTVVLDGVTVGGRLVVRGGGVNTIYLKNTVTGSIFIEKLSDGGIRIHADDGSPVEFISIADGNDGIVIECDVASLSIAGSDLDVAISGRVENLTVSGNNVTLSGSGSVGAVLLEKGVTGIVILAEYATILNNSGETVAVTGKDGKSMAIATGETLDASGAAGFIADETDSGPDVCSVNFHSDGGGDFSPVTLYAGRTLGALPLPYKENMVFLGWFADDGTFADLVTEDTPIGSNTDLYACYLPTTPPDEINERTTTSVMDVDPDFRVTVLSSESSMSAGEVKAAIAVDPLNEDDEEFGGITVTGGAGSYVVGATDGYTLGYSYSLTLTDDALSFDGKGSTVRTYNITAKKPAPVLNLQLDGSVKAIPVGEISNIVDENGAPVASIYAPLLDLDGEPVEEISGMFVYSGSLELFLGDKLAIYEGTPPSEREAGLDYSEQHIAYVDVTGVNGGVISYSNSDASEVLFTPDVLPVDVEDDSDGPDNSSITIDIDRLTFADGSLAEMGLGPSTVVEVGDYLAFYEGEGLLDDGASLIGYARILSVTVSGENYVIAYTSVTEEELRAAMDMAGSRTLTYDQLSENTDIPELEKDLQQQFIKNGFADAAAGALIELANADLGTREQVMSGLGMKNFSATVSDAPMLMAASSPSISVSATISNDLEHFGGYNGLRCDVTVTCAVAIGDNLGLTITGTFEQEIKVNLDISSHAVWKVWGIFPYIADYQITASLDVYNYTGLKLNALLASDDGSESLNIQDSIQSLQDPNSGTPEQKSGAVRRFYEIYQDMMGQDHDYFELFSIPIFKITGYVDPFCIIAYGFKAEFVVSLDVLVSLGVEFGYEKAKRYSVTLQLFKKNATTSQADLIDENYGLIAYAMGTIGVRAGVRLTVEVGLLSIDLDSIGFSAEVGGYWRIWGFVYYQLEHRKGQTTSSYGGAFYMELGVYLEVDFVAQVGAGALSFVATLYEHEWPLLTVGDRYYTFDFQYDLDDGSDDIVLKDITSYQLPWSIFRVLQMDLYTGVISEKGYGPADFTLALQNDGYHSFRMYNTGLLTITPPYFHKTQATLTVTWNGGPMAFTSKPISRTFDVKWDNLEDSYAINFVPNGGNCVNSISAEYGAPITLPVPKLTGYTFDGWYLDDGTFAKGYNIDWMPDSNPTLYAKWVPAQVPFTVLYRFERLDSSWYTDWSVSYVGLALTGADIAPIVAAGGVTGFTAPAVPVDQGGKILVAADGSTTVELKYVRNAYTMTYKPNNGEDDVVASVKYLSQPQEPSFIRPGWTFGGWYTDDGTFSNRHYSFWPMPAHDVTVYAKWAHDVYSITYDVQGGGFKGSPNPEIYYGDSAEFTLVNPVKAESIFLGWSGTGLSAPTKTVTIPAGSTGNRYYTAQWQPYDSISYNLAGGSTEGSNPTSYSVETLDFTLINPSRDGYIFSGWTGTGLSGASTEVTVPTGSTGNRQYTATWVQIVDYKVRHLVETFDVNWSSTVYQIAETETLSGPAGSLTAAVAKTYEGHTAGPVTQEAISPNGTTMVDISYELTRYNATFDPGSGTGGGVVSVGQSTWMFWVSRPAVSREHYDLNGWSPSIPTFMPAQDLTFTAQWRPHDYSITYDLVGGTGAGLNPASYSIETAGFTLTNPTRYGYVFAGWTGTDIDLLEPAMDVTIPTGSTGDRQYTATWDEDTSATYYALAFWSEYLSGTQVGYTQRLLEGDTIVPPMPTRTGYHVITWYTGDDWADDPDGLLAYLVDGKLYYDWEATLEVKMPGHDLTLYAEWESNTYTVVLDANDAVSSHSRINPETHAFENYDTLVKISPLTCWYDSLAWLPLAHVYSDVGEYVDGTPVTFSGTRYELIGWNTKADGTGTSYERGDLIINLTAVSGGEVTLYAQWRPIGEFGVLEAFYSVVGQTFGFDSGTDTLQDALLDASVADKPVLDIGSLRFNHWESGYFRVRKTGDADNPFALYMYNSSGRPYVPQDPEAEEDPWADPPAGSLIGSGANDGLNQACKESLESLYGAGWARGLMTVGNITKLGTIGGIGETDVNDGFVFTSVNGVSYFICGTATYGYRAEYLEECMGHTVPETSPTMEEIDAVRTYISGPETPGG